MASGCCSDCLSGRPTKTVGCTFPLKKLYGNPLLQEHLQREISGLEASIASANAAADSSISQLLSLTLNSMQRLHANLMCSDTEEEEAGPSAHLVNVDDIDDDDDDDCFFMPMPGAVKWAEPKRFESLAQPIGPDAAQGTQFVLVMEPGGFEFLGLNLNHRCGG